jgi:hypothetical protein
MPPEYLILHFVEEMFGDELASKCRSACGPNVALMNGESL